MAKRRETIEGRLARVTARLEQAAQQKKAGGPTSALAPFALGALIGTGAALLYAPQPGERTRTIFRQSADKVRARATRAASSAKEQIPEGAKAALTRTKGRAANLAARGKDKAPAAQADAGTGAPGINEAAGGVGEWIPPGEGQVQPRRDRASGRENAS